MRWRRLSSPALWVAGLWLTIISSRQVSFWLNTVGLGGSRGSSNLEGSPINVIFNGSLFLAAIVVLNRRNFDWAQFAKGNKALVMIYSYFALSVLWSQLPLPTFKRLSQDFGCVLTGLIILTEKDPGAALRTVFVRVSYFLFPLSVVFIRYFPDIGRAISSVSGTHMVCGVAGHKNTLGQLTMVLALVLLWDILETHDREPAQQSRTDRWPRLTVLGIGVYLLIICGSATALLCFVFGVMLLIAGKRLARMERAHRIIITGAISLTCVLILDQTIGVSETITKALGRDTTLTGRTDMWRVIYEKDINPLLGAGFRGFWETMEGESVYEELGMNRLLTAHNGYLETYLNGGLFGVFLLSVLMLSTGLNTANKLVKGDPIGRMAAVFWPITLIYNVTESSFFILGPLWFTMLLVTNHNLGLTHALAQKKWSGQVQYAHTL